MVCLTVISFAPLASGEEKDAEKAFRSFAEFRVGGIWKATDHEGKAVTQKYRWFADKRFLRVTSTTAGEFNDNVEIVGIDPANGKLTWWRFASWGILRPELKQLQDGVWNINTTFTVNQEEVTWDITFTRLNQDELQLGFERTWKGKKESFDPQMWKRHEK